MKRILLWRLLPAAVVLYVDGRCDSADDERHAAADQVVPGRDEQAKTVRGGGPQPGQAHLQNLET